MVLKSEQLSVEEKPLDCPPLEDVAKALKNKLSKNFEKVEVSVVECPDMTQKPFSLAAKGLGGSPTIVEVGGVPNLMPLVDRSKVYDFKDMNQLTGISPAFIIGAGAGPFPYVKVNSELMANVVVQDRKVHTLTQIAKLKDESKGDEFVTEILPQAESCYSLMGNLFVSEGKPGKVLKVYCKKRTGPDNFVKVARDSLVEGFPGKCIGVGGVFLISGSKAKHHIMPDFSRTPLVSEEMIDKWLYFYNLNPPLVSVGTFVTNDPGLNLRVTHFHSYSDHNEGGHYHNDIEPESVEYLAYFNLGTRVVRIDRPVDESKLGQN